MALTKKMLMAMDIPAEKADEIISAHVESINVLRDERDKYKADADRLVDVEKKLNAANAEIEQFKSGDWEKKYEAVKAEYESFKTDTKTKAVKAAKEGAYRKMLLDAGIPEKRIASIMRVTDVDAIELDADGSVKDADSIADNIKTEWADFIATEAKKGAETANPPKGDDEGTAKPSVAKQLAEAYQREHYGTLAGN